MAFTLVWFFGAWKVAVLETFQGHWRVISKQPLAGPNSNFMFFSMMFGNMRLPWQGMVVENVWRDVYCFLRKPSSWIGNSLKISSHENQLFLSVEAKVMFFFWFLCAKDSAKIIWKSKIMWNQNLKQEQPGVHCDFTVYVCSSQVCFFPIGNLPCTRKKYLFVAITFSIIPKYFFPFAGLEITQQHRQKHGPPESWIFLLAVGIP